VSSTPDIVIVGGGLAGLACANTLIQAGFSCTVFEASDQVGGRVRTDHVNGFLLDHGFQVFLTAYPEAQRFLDYQRLDLQSFFSGALIRTHDRFMTVADPLRHPWEGLQSLFHPIGILRDKWLILQLRRQTASQDFSDHLPSSQTTLSEALKAFVFSETMRLQFFRPFFGGVFSDWNLQTSKPIFEFVFSMFAKGLTTIPAQGMGAIPDQLASSLPPGTVRTHAKVRSVHPTQIELESGERIAYRVVVIATEQPEAERLTNIESQGPQQHSHCLYYAAHDPPVSGPFLVLNGTGRGPVNHLSVVSQVAPTYAPPGMTLISVTVLNHEGLLDDLDPLVRQHMSEWFGPMAKDWRPIRTFSNRHTRSRLTAGGGQRPVGHPPNSHVFLCGDYFHSPTHHGALLSGRNTAESVMAHLH